MHLNLLVKVFSLKLLIPTFNDSKVVIDNLGQGSKAVGGAGGIRDNSQALVILVMVDTHHKHGSISRGSGDDHLLGTSLGVSQSLVIGGEHSCTLNNVLSSCIREL